MAEGLELEIGSAFCATVRLEPRIYSREAILRACYWHTAVAFIQVPESADGRLVVQVKMKQQVPTLENPTPITATQFVDEFCNSLIDFELRRQVETETGPLRQLILAKAFSASGVLEDAPPGDIADPVEVTKPSSLVQLMQNLRPNDT